MNVEFKDLDYRVVEAPDEGGFFAGYAALFDVVDSLGDIIERGAFTKTLGNKSFFPMLWNNDIYTPLGIAAAKEDDSGLWISGRFNLEVKKALEIYSLMRQGAVKGLSMGYRTIRQTVDSLKKRHLLEIDLWEVSPTVFGPYPSNQIIDVRGAGASAFDIMATVDELEMRMKLLLMSVRIEGLRDEIKNLTGGIS